MTDPALTAIITAAAALVGALIGGGAAVATSYVQANAETRRQRTRVAAELAVAERRLLLDTGARTLAPISAYVHLFTGLLELQERGKLTADAYRKLVESNDELMRIAIEVSGTPMRMNDPDAKRKPGAPNAAG